MKKIHPKTFKWLIWAIFILYMTVLLDLVFFSVAFGRANAEILRYQTINIIPFRTIKNYLGAWEVVNPRVIITNIYGNIAAFFPFGLLTPLLFKKMKSLGFLLITSVLFSLFIEVIQGLMGVGVVDIDDIILNTFGSLIGYGFFVILFKTFKTKESK